MKTSILIYIISLAILAAAILIIVFNPNSGQSYVVSGGLAVLGFPLNIAGFLLKRSQSK